MDLSTFFRPLNEDLIRSYGTHTNHMLGRHVHMYVTDFPELPAADIVIIGCDEDRGGKEIQGAALAPDLIRKQLYQLILPHTDARIADLGNLLKKDTLISTYDQLAEVTWELIRRGKMVIILGGSNDVAYGQYLAYANRNKKVEYVSIDSDLDLQDSDFGINNHSYNHKILLHSPNFLFNFTNLGYQSHFVSVADRKRMRNLYFPAVRLGELRDDIKEAEPYLRNADLLSVDMSVIRSSDAPGTSRPSPAGFSTEEICQVMRYAGMSHKLSSMSICEANPLRDFNEQTTMMAALMLWYFMEGFYNRKEDEPLDLSAMTKYRTSLQNSNQEIVFYKNEKTLRWWMEVPFPEALGEEEGKFRLQPCSEKDYLLAQQDEISERWWFCHHKLR